MSVVELSELALKINALVACGVSRDVIEYFLNESKAIEEEPDETKFRQQMDRTSEDLYSVTVHVKYWKSAFRILQKNKTGEDTCSVPRRDPRQPGTEAAAWAAFVEWMSNKVDFMEVTFLTFRNAWQFDSADISRRLETISDIARFGNRNTPPEQSFRKAFQEIIDRVAKKDTIVPEIAGPNKTASGLFNVGNSCYMNSILQIIADTDWKQCELVTESMDPSSSLSKLLHAIRKEAEDSCSLLKDFIKQLRQRASQKDTDDQTLQARIFSGGTQEDALQCFQFFREYCWPPLKQIFPLIKSRNFIVCEVCGEVPRPDSVRDVIDAHFP